MQFYSIKHKKKVDVDDSKVNKVTYERKTKNGKTMTTYAAKAEVEVEGDMVKLTKFMKKEDWDKLSD